MSRDERPLPKIGVTYTYRGCFARGIRRSRGHSQPLHIAELTQAGGQVPAMARYTLCDVEAARYTENGNQGDPANATCLDCRRIYRQIMAVTDQHCPGSGRPWFRGDGHPICKTCHQRPAAIGARVPRGRIAPRSGWKGRVPPHLPRTA